MKSKLLIVMMLLALPMAAKKVPKGARLIHAIVKSEMVRHPEAWTIDGQQKPKWNYTQGLELLGMYGCMSDADWMRYAKTYTDVLIDSAGHIRGYKKGDFKLDAINSGKILFLLYDLTKDERYKVAMDTLFQQLKEQPRCPEGGFWHKTIYPHQMWLDGQYMALPFYLEYARRFLDAEAYQAVEADVKWRQLMLIEGKTRCEECRLLHHAWDAAKVQPWANKETGQSAHAWGRAEGWYLMALVDCLDLMFPDGVPPYDGGAAAGCIPDLLSGQLNQLSARLLELQDEKTGTWQQVLDLTGKEGNYQEMTCTAMFAYAFLKGTRLGVLEKSYREAAERALKGIRAHFMSVDEAGLVSLHNCCAVAGLSDTRDGSFEYYLSEPRIDNDPKGIGPLLMALKEYELTR